jgi:hypothetical protein
VAVSTRIRSKEEHDMGMTAAQAAAEQTGTNPDQWKLTSGPETGVGVEYWLAGPKDLTAYVCIDQGEVIACEIHNAEEE